MSIQWKSPVIPENIPENLHKNFKMLVCLDVICLLVHAYMIILFHDLHIPFMRRFNYFSVIWFALLLVLMFRNRKNLWFCATYAIIGEIILHQSLAVIFIGPDSGFQYFILVAAVCFTYFPEKKRYHFYRLGISAIGILVFIWLSLRSRSHPPLYAIPSGRLTFLFILCCSLSMGVIIGVMYASYRSNERTFRELEEKNRQIVSASEAKINFLANMSHEIRTPMNAILGMTDLILSEPISRTVREKTENIYTASRSLLTIINDILDFSKIESGKMEVINDEYRLSYLLADVYFLMAPKAETKGLTLSVVTEGEAPDRLIGDEIRLKQVLLNLVSNAVKYTEAGSVTIRISARPVKEGVNLKIAVEDTGIGIRPPDLDKLFTSFTQVNTRQNRRIEGTGLGLAISRQLVGLMGGFMNVESEYKKGSVFSFVLPQAVSDPAPMAFESGRHHVIEDIRAQNIQIYNFTAPEAKILIVDDVEMNLKVAMGLLTPYRMRVETALSGGECLEMLRRSPDYDIVFMDHMMPVMDGVDAVKLIRAEEGAYYRMLPVVALTANALSEAKAILLDAGMNDFITKPIDMHDMSRILLRWLPDDKVHYINESEWKNSVSSEAADTGLPFTLPDVDLKQGMAYSGGKTQYMEFLSIYCESAEQILKRLTVSVRMEDWKQYEIDAHALKSASAGIGAQKVSALARELEKAARGDQEFVRRRTPELLTRTENLLQAIQMVLPARKIARESRQSAPFHKLLPELRQLADSINDFMPDSKLLESLLHIQCTDVPSYEENMREIRNAVNHFDYEDAAGRLTALLNQAKGGDASGED